MCSNLIGTKLAALKNLAMFLGLFLILASFAHSQDLFLPADESPLGLFYGLSSEEIREEIRSRMESQVTTNTSSINAIDRLALRAIQIELENDPDIAFRILNFNNTDFALLMNLLEQFADISKSLTSQSVNSMCNKWNENQTSDLDTRLVDALIEYEISLEVGTENIAADIDEKLIQIRDTLSTDKWVLFLEYFNSRREWMMRTESRTFSTNIFMYGDPIATMRMHCDE